MEAFCFMTWVTNQNPSISSDWKKKCFHVVLEHFNRLVNDHANLIPPKGGGARKCLFGSVLWNKLAIKSFQLHFMLSITSSTGYTGYSETQWKKWSSHFSFWSSCSSAVENACFWNGAQQLSFQFSFEASNTCVKMVFALPATKKAVITVSCYELFHLWP